MKATVDDLKRYAYCPKFFEQQGPLHSIHDASTEDFTKLVTFLFRRDMETGSKQSWKSTEKRWNKIFFGRISCEPNDDQLRSFNRSLSAIKKFHNWYLQQTTDAVAVNYTLSATVYDHQVIGELPVLLAGPRGITIITTKPLTTPDEAMLEPAIRYLSMALDEEMPIDGVQNIALIDYQVFHMESFIPPSRYYELAVLDFVNLMSSMQSGFMYPNTMACNTCPIKMTCEVMKAYVL